LQLRGEYSTTYHFTVAIESTCIRVRSQNRGIRKRNPEGKRSLYAISNFVIYFDIKTPQQFDSVFNF
jgi:uncharacterized membrane protein